MSKEREQNHEKMEHLLRNWGAEEAVRQARVDYLRPPAPRRAVPAPSVWQWLPLVASLVLVGGAGVLLLLTQPGASSSAADVEQLREAVDASERKWKAAAEALSEVRAERERLAETVAESQKLLAAAQAELRAKASEAAEQAAKLAAAAEQVREMARTASESEAALKAAREQLKLREQEMASLQKAAEGARAAEDETSRLRAQLAQQKENLGSMLSDKRILASRLSALQAERDVMRTMLRRLYIAAAAPGQAGVSARQVAARENRLIERCGELRRAIRSPAVRKLADQVEVALTRLELLDPARPTEVDGLASFIAQADILSRIEEVLAADEEPAAVRSWLLEAQLVLTEVKGEGS